MLGDQDVVLGPGEVNAFDTTVLHWFGRTGAIGARTSVSAACSRPENLLGEGRCFDVTRGSITFRRYVEDEWLPSKHLEASTLAAYHSYLDRHFLPAFGDRQMSRITPSAVQDWVTHAAAEGLSAR